jgi:protein-S-isoprenylcysteine O-methyltransferase Ste14
MPPRYGLPLAALFTIAVLVVLAAIWVVVSRARVEAVRKNWQRPGPRTAVAVGVLSAALSLSGAAVYSDDEPGRSFWFYVGYWVFLAAIPLSLAFWILASWAKRTRPSEWASVSRGVSWSELSPALRRGYVAVVVVGLLPAAIVGSAIFRT